MLVSGETLLYPCLGDPIAQVKSPGALTRIFASRGCNALSVPAHVNPSNFKSVVQALAMIQNIAGALVTVPHKLSAFDMCSTLTDRAEFTESVNVMRRTNDGWFGDATDGQGFLDGLEKKRFRASNKRALLVGCGGAGSAIALELLKRGVAELAIYDIDQTRQSQIIATLNKLGLGKVRAGSPDPTGFDLVANATPLGMRFDDPLPVDVVKLKSDQVVACVVTRPEQPPLIEAARSEGCATMTGTEMFEAQAEALADFLTATSDQGDQNSIVS